MNRSIKSRAARAGEWWRHAISDFGGAVIMERAIKDRKGINNSERCKGQKTVSKRRGAGETKSLILHCIQKSRMSETYPLM